MPAEAKFNVPGFALAAATRSATVLKPRRCRDQHARLDSEQDHRREIAQWIVRQGLVQHDVRAQRGRVQQDRVAVRVGLCHEGGADHPAAARPVLDHEGLAELLRHLVEHDASDDVVGIARGERAHHLDGTARPRVRRGCRRAGRENEDGAAHRAK